MASEAVTIECIIVNKVRAPDGSELAVTYKEPGSPLPVQKRDDSVSQTWFVRGSPGGLQTISPVGDINLQVAPLHGVYAVAKQGHYSWRIKGDLNEVVIYEIDPSWVWGLPEAVPGAPVILNPLESEKQKWELIQVNAA